MLEIIGLLGCIWGIVIGGAIGLIATGTTAIIGYEQMEQAEENADAMEALQKQAQEKAEARQKKQADINTMLNARNLRRTRAQVAGAVAYERLLTERASRANTKKTRELNEARKYDQGNPIANDPAPRNIVN